MHDIPAPIIYYPEKYQDHTTQYIKDNPFCGVFLEMGLGKTVSTLTAILDLKYRQFEINKTLVLAPKLVAQNTWHSEIEKWQHLNRLSYSHIMGTEKQRAKALVQNSDIYLTNYDNLPWLVAYMGGFWDFDYVVCDESTRLKNHASKRTQAIREVMPFVDRLTLLSGTPMPNGYIDLWAQIFLLDKGERLGKKITHYRNTYFDRSYSGWGYTIKSKKHATAITDAIADVCVSMRQKDYLSLPDRIERVYKLRMGDSLKEQYKRFEKERVMELVEGQEKITAINAAVLTNKLLQFANGAVYDADKNYHVVHDLKLEALAEILEGSNGHPVLVAYEFESDKDRICKGLAKYNPEVLNGKSQVKVNSFIRRWNEGSIPFALAHPASAGHGLNLQAGGHIIVFFGHNWSNELRKQFIARLERKGQTCSVIVTDIVLAGTMDERVLRRQAEKESDESFVMDQVKALIREHAGTRGNRLIENSKQKYSFLD